jgi:hypothetical protein
LHFGSVFGERGRIISETLSCCQAYRLNICNILVLPENRLLFQRGFMKKLILSALVLALAGCAGSTLHVIGSAQAKLVEIDGVQITVSPIAGDDWGATDRRPHWGPKVATLWKPRYFAAVEAVTACKIVDSNYDAVHDMFTARVSCKK